MAEPRVSIPIIKPDWHLPQPVKAVVTCASSPLASVKPMPYGEFNMAQHVGDNAAKVDACRAQLAAQLKVPRWQWLNQVHGTGVVPADVGIDSSADSYFDAAVYDSTSPVGQQALAVPTADACFTRQKGLACSILTADCLPVLLCNAQGTQVAAAHAGWRGLAAGVLEQTCKTFNPRDELLAYLGPAISVRAFEVGAEVKTAFMQAFGSQAQACFFANEHNPKHFFADLYALARLQLAALGVVHVSGGHDCTFSDARFYSYRRQPVTGRFASAIWLDEAG